MSSGDDGSTDVLAELAEAEAAEAQARADADLARARAKQLRTVEVPAPDIEQGEPGPGETEQADPEQVDPEEEDPPARSPSRPRRFGAVARVAVVAVVALLIGAALAVTALMLSEHAKVAAQRAEHRAVVEAARNGVVALLSIDHTRADADVQRVLDLSSGSFRDEFAADADDFVRTAVDSQAVTKGSISAAALQSVRDDSAVVLVAASSTVTNVSGAKDDPRPWRMSVTVTRDGDIWKMSDVEFVP